LAAGPALDCRGLRTDRSDITRSAGNAPLVDAHRWHTDWLHSNELRGDVA
jgi:hypothetical protein